VQWTWKQPEPYYAQLKEQMELLSPRPPHAFLFSQQLLFLETFAASYFVKKCTTIDL
jgi:hypothetical protein